jgi:hypothetical protein
LSDILQVVELYSQRESSPYLNGLDNVAREVTNECGSLIQGLLNRWRAKYHDSLQPEGSGNVIRDWGRKIEWSLREQEVVREFQEKLAQGIQRLTLLMCLAAR